MNFKSLLYFIHVARMQSFNQASLYLGIAQPALSRQVRKLEEQLGCELLVRSSKGVRTTNAGDTLLEHGDTILRRIEAARSAVKSQNDTMKGEMVLGVVSGPGQSVIPKLIERMRINSPKIKLKVIECDSTSIVHGLMNENLDAAIGNHDIIDPKLRVQVLYSEAIELVGPVNDPANIFNKLDGDLSPKDLENIPLILPGQRHALRILIDKAAQSENIILTTTDEINGSSIVKRMVENGLGYSFFGTHYIETETTKKSLLSRKVASAAFNRTTSFITLTGKPQSQICREVLKTLKVITDQF